MPCKMLACRLAWMEGQPLKRRCPLGRRQHTEGGAVAIHCTNLPKSCAGQGAPATPECCGSHCSRAVGAYSPAAMLPCRQAGWLAGTTGSGRSGVEGAILNAQQQLLFHRMAGLVTHTLLVIGVGVVQGGWVGLRVLSSCLRGSRPAPASARPALWALHPA